MSTKDSRGKFLIDGSVIYDSRPYDPGSNPGRGTTFSRLVLLIKRQTHIEIWGAIGVREGS